ncbi:CD164 sialomucin-like 2 protein isoform X2 [Amia ocellicauda]|uniref:CD164 sialomucin-like 2 protein isoform X2 n=1 Tax=Amia ocellicauda TaxID=2972642 RepID=UPI003464CF76
MLRGKPAPAALAALAVLVFAALRSCSGGCSQMDSCSSCIPGDASQNITGCVWLQCDNGNDTGCVDSSADYQGCSAYNDTSLCSAPDSTGPSGRTDEPTTQPMPVFKQANFDLSSFIGGIILVLGAQAAIFFVIKFVKSRDSAYETLI